MTPNVNVGNNDLRKPPSSAVQASGYAKQVPVPVPYNIVAFMSGESLCMYFLPSAFGVVAYGVVSEGCTPTIF